MSREVFACMSDVGVDLPRQGVEIRVALFIAQLVQEFNRHTTAVDRFVEIEDKYFEHRLAIGLHRRPHAQARHTGARRSIQALHANRENTGERRLVAKRNVGRRETEPLTSLIAVRDATSDR